MTKPAKPHLIEIFRAGRHQDSAGNVVNLTAADIADIAAQYDPAISEAPLVVGHPETNGPAQGWVKALHAEGDMLLAEPHQVNATFADMANAGAFKKRSASLFSPTAPNHPKPGHWYLRHVGWLGAAAPAVKGLKDYAFADGAEGIVEFGDTERWGFRAIADLFSRVRDFLVADKGIEAADRIIADWQIEQIRDAARPESEAAISFVDPASTAPTEDTDVTDRTNEFAERETKLAQQANDLATREAAIAQRESDARRVEVVSFTDNLVKAGRLLPRFKPQVIELLVALEPGQTLNFSDGTNEVSRPTAEVVRELLSSLPVQVNFSERVTEDVETGAHNFSTPPGFHVAPGSMELHAKAKAYMAAHPGVDIVAATAAVGG